MTVYDFRNCEGWVHGVRCGMDEISFYNRLTGRMETEQVYGEGFLKWVYGSALGKLSMHALVKRGFFSTWYGRRMDAPASRGKILPFIREFGVPVEEMEEPVEKFETFNQFFYRRLKPEARPIKGDDRVLVMPADGRHLLIEDVSAASDFWVKGVKFDLKAFVGDESLASEFEGGSLLISRLCPVDYHRFHFPCGGVAGPVELINGWLYSVSPLALRQRASILWENKRYRTAIEASGFGRVMFFEIGATCVGSVVHTSAEGARVDKGQEKGYFRFGGSSVVTLVARGTVNWDEDLREQGARGVEVYARMGDRAGTNVNMYG
jgi:phosphatidylserine decarboxylase